MTSNIRDRNVILLMIYVCLGVSLLGTLLYSVLTATYIEKDVIYGQPKILYGISAIKKTISEFGLLSYSRGLVSTTIFIFFVSFVSSFLVQIIIRSKRGR